jgi:hypothetical protein
VVHARAQHKKESWGAASARALSKKKRLYTASSARPHSPSVSRPKTLALALSPWLLRASHPTPPHRMASVPIAATGAAALAAAGATSWLRAHQQHRGSAAEKDSCAAAHSSPALQPGTAVALFDGRTGGMLGVSSRKDRAVNVGPPAGRRPEPSDAASVFSDDDGDNDDLSLPAFPAEALFVVEAGTAKPASSIVLRSIG